MTATLAPRKKREIYYTEAQLAVKTVGQLEQILSKFARPKHPSSYGRNLRLKAPWIRAIIETQESQRKDREAGIQLSLFDALPAADTGLEEKSPVSVVKEIEDKGAAGFVGEPPAPAAPVSVPPGEGEGAGEKDKEKDAPTTESAPAPLEAPVAPTTESAPAPLAAPKLQEGMRVVIALPGDEWNGYAGILVSPHELSSCHKRKLWELRSVAAPASPPDPRQWWISLDYRAINMLHRETSLVPESLWRQETGLDKFEGLSPGCEVVVADPAEEWDGRTGELYRPFEQIVLRRP